MIHFFLNFKLDTSTKDLFHNSEKVHLTQQNFLLLKAFIENANNIVEKQTLMEHVWESRLVQDNTIDQGISKLRKLLNTHQQADYISVGYGKGWKFLPEIRSNQIKSKPAKPVLWLILFVAVGMIYLIWHFRNNISNKPVLMFLPQSHQETREWWSAGGTEIIENFLGSSHDALLKRYQAEEKEMDPNEYLHSLKQVLPDLTVFSILIDRDSVSELFHLNMSIEHRNKPTETKVFKNGDITKLYLDAGLWLTNHYELKINNDSILPSDSKSVQLFLEGLKNLELGEFTKSINYLQLSLQESPSFNLARIKLAEALKKNNQFDQALVQLKTIQPSDLNTALQLKIIGLHGDIFEIQGKHDLAKKLYEQTLESHQPPTDLNLLNIRYSLSDVYFSLADNTQALKQLNIIEQSIGVSTHPYLLADTYRQQGQIHFTNGNFKQANDYTQKALRLYTDLSYMAGQTRAFASLSRFYQHQHRYQEAIGYINKALALARIQKNKLMMGAAINQLIYLLNVQGHISKAWNLNLEMEHIGLETGFTRMVIAAKHHFVELARNQRKYKQAKANLEEHLRLATETNNKRAIHTNNLLMLDFLLDQKITNGVQELIYLVQNHIDDTGEIRLQPIINLKQAQLNLLLDKTEHIVPLLEQSLAQAKQTEDGETIVDIHNFLAKYYLKESLYELALAQLRKNTPFHPAPNPYLVIKAKIFQQQGKLTEAIELLNQCKLAANESWYEEDEMLLQQLVQQRSEQASPT